MPVGFWKAADADEPEPTPQQDTVRMKHNLGAIAQLGSIKNERQRHDAARTLLDDVNAIVERGKARRAQQDQARKGKGK